jgi:hypothetical protein
MPIETATTCPLSVTNGDFAAQAAHATDPAYLARFQMALAAAAEYIINQEGTSTTDHLSRGITARIVASNVVFWAQEMAYLIAVDPVTINSSSTDQQILNRVWTIWPVVAYKAAYYSSTGTAFPSGAGTTSP